MQICHVMPRYAPAISGAEFYMQRVSEVLCKDDDVHVHCTTALDFAALHSPRGKHVPASVARRNKTRATVTRHPIVYDTTRVEQERQVLHEALPRFPGDAMMHGPCSPAMRAALFREHPAIFHVTCYPYLNVYYTLMAAIEQGIPSVLTPFMHPENPRYDPAAMEVLGSFTKLLACTPSERDFLIRAGIKPASIEPITMGVDVERFQRADPAPFFRATGVSPGDFVVLFCGYKNHEKGAITLLHAVPALVKAIPRCKVVMIGPPTSQYNQEVRKVGGDHVININPASLSGYFDPVKLGAFAACSVYAMPSRSDAYGIAYLEAWAAGKPVIAADIPAMRDLFKPGQGGYHVPFDDPDALARRITMLHADRDEREAAGAAGHARIHDEGLTWTRVARRIRAIYEVLT